MEIIIKGDAQEIAKFVEKLQSWNKNCSGWYTIQEKEGIRMIFKEWLKQHKDDPSAIGEKLQSWNKNCSGWYRKPYTDEWVRCNAESSFTASAHESIPSKRD